MSSTRASCGENREPWAGLEWTERASPSQARHTRAELEIQAGLLLQRMLTTTERIWRESQMWRGVHDETLTWPDTVPSLPMRAHSEGSSLVPVALKMLMLNQVIGPIPGEVKQY